MSDPAKYVMGWICAIITEYVAAQEFLDEEHEGPSFVSPNDTNDYTLGKIWQHNVVIAVLPESEYGIAPAASVATNMLNSFPNVRIGLMVGIGGGVPSEKHDVRLGDVVVSAARDGLGGVFQYDFGKSIQGQSFQHTRLLNQPPTSLRTAVAGIQAQYRRKGHRLKECINSIVDKNARLQRDFRRPEAITDRLFKAQVVHRLGDCAALCAADSSNLVTRRERTEHEDNPAIHYGLIASANSVMRDALTRDRLAADKDVLCFDMEAAGLMNNFPCLVIRGICDYSDSHKSKEWQGYASMVAAAYAKDLLRRIPPNKVEAEKRISDILSGGLQDVTRIAQKQLQIQENTVKRKLSDKEEECLQLFRLTHDTKDITYEWYKRRVETRVDGTCEWLLNHENFQKWLKEDSQLLLVTADPGCGKSVLAKYLIDERLPRSSTICYFFFKDQDQDTARQALCALLHQLFSKTPSLISHAMVEYARNGQGMINSTKLLWDILGNTVQDPKAGHVIIVLDALDECAESEFEDLIRNIESQFRGKQSGQSNLKYLLTSRPYEQIVCKFTGMLESFPNIRIPGEEESEIINREINFVIQYRVEQLAKERRISDQLKNRLAKRLLEIRHRTYLWVYLVFGYLTKESFKKTPSGVDAILATLPSSIYDAYERILNKSKKDPMVRRALSIILVATRPLSLFEMNVALNVHGRLRSIHDLDLEEKEDFKSRLRTWCGLFISIYRDKVYFLHQTAREFLLAQASFPTTAPLESGWRHSITSQSAHRILAEICVYYLDFLNNRTIPTDARTGIRQNIDKDTFLDYPVKNWVFHYRKACASADAGLTPPILRLCSPDSKSCSTWLSGEWYHTGYGWSKSLTSLMVSSLFGLEAVVMVLLANGDELDSRDQEGETPLSYAAGNGHEIIVKLLLEKGAELNPRNKLGETPLHDAARKGYHGVVKLLLEEGADFESKGNCGQTPLSSAAGHGHETIIKLLLEKGAAIDSSDFEFRTPLSLAAASGKETVVNLLLEKGATIDSKDVYIRTPLSYAAAHGCTTIVMRLLEKGAHFDSSANFFMGDDHDLGDNRDWEPQSPFKTIFRLLREMSTFLGPENDPNFEDDCEWAQELRQAHNQLQSAIKQQCEKFTALGPRDDPGLGDDCGRTLQSYLLQELETLKQFACHPRDIEFGRSPLSLAAEDGHEDIVRILLERGAHLESIHDAEGMTPLSWAAAGGHEGVVKLLLENGANIESRDCDSRTPLSRAFANGHGNITMLLLEKGAEFDPEDNRYDQTPLSWAAGNGHENIVKLLLEKGTTFDSRNHWGRTPLSYAAENGHEAIVKLLLEKGANFNSRDHWGGTPLSYAAKYGHEAIVKLVLEKGANFDSGDYWGGTPLSYAAKNRHEAIVKLLQKKGVNSSGNDKRGNESTLSGISKLES